MTTSSSSVIIILVLNILTTPSFVSSTETRNDDLTLSGVQTVVQQQAALLQTLQAKLTADENIIHQQAALLKTLQAKVAADESTIQQIQAKQSTMEARQNKNVAFTATFAGGTHPVNIGAHGIVKFDHVITNIGGAYNAAMGIFTAPIAGTYAFFFNAQGDNLQTQPTFMEVNKNGNNVLCMTVMESAAHDLYDKGTCFAVSHLIAGDQVFARESGGGMSINENAFSSLSGFLVQAD